MNSPQNSKKPNPKKSSREWFPGSIFLWIFLFLSIFYFARVGSMPLEKQSKQLAYGQFYAMLEANQKTPALKSGVRIADEVSGDLINGEKYHVLVP